MRTTGLAGRVAARERAALESLTEATAGSGLCRPSGAGRPADAKTLEGAVAALSEARRALRASDRAEHSPEDPCDADQALSDREVLDHVHAAWAERALALATRGEAWRRYLEGGLAALRSLLDEHAQCPDEPGQGDGAS